MRLTQGDTPGVTEGNTVLGANLKFFPTLNGTRVGFGSKAKTTGFGEIGATNTALHARHHGIPFAVLIFFRPRPRFPINSHIHKLVTPDLHITSVGRPGTQFISKAFFSLLVTPHLVRVFPGNLPPQPVDRTLFQLTMGVFRFVVVLNRQLLDGFG